MDRPQKFVWPWYSYWNFYTMFRYFAEGNAKFGIVKYVILFIGGAGVLTSGLADLGVILTVAYALCCFAWGFFWDHMNLVMVERHWDNARQHWKSFREGFDGAA